MADSGKSPVRVRKEVSELRVDLPPLWMDQLKEAAAAQAITVSALVRIVLRSFLRERLSAEEQRRLEVKAG